MDGLKSRLKQPARQAGITLKHLKPSPSLAGSRRGWTSEGQAGRTHVTSSIRGREVARSGCATERKRGACLEEIVVHGRLNNGCGEGAKGSRECDAHGFRCAVCPSAGSDEEGLLKQPEPLEKGASERR